MTLFILFAAALIVVALTCLLPVLLRQAKSGQSNAVVNTNVLQDQLQELDGDRQAGTLDAQSYANARQELEQRIAIERADSIVSAAPGQKRLASALVILVPLAAIGLYLLIGAPAALNPDNLVPQQTQDVSQQQILGMVQKLADRMKQQPGDAQGWNMLARSYFELHRFQDAADAYSHLVQLAPDNADYLASYGLTMALARNKNLQGEPEQLLQRALKLDPKNIRALSLLGSAAFDRHDYSQAISYWNQVLPLAPPDSAIAQSTTTSIEEAKVLLKDGAQNSIVRLPGQ